MQLNAFNPFKSSVISEINVLNENGGRLWNELNDKSRYVNDVNDFILVGNTERLFLFK